VGDAECHLAPALTLNEQRGWMVVGALMGWIFGHGLDNEVEVFKTGM